MSIWLNKILFTIENNPKLSNSTKEEFKRFLIYNFKLIENNMTSKYKTRKCEYKQVISYLTTEDKNRLRNYCHNKGLTISGLIRRELLQLISNENI